MGVNRELRDQLADALVQWASGQCSRSEMREVARRIKHQLADATDAPSLQDDGCDLIAYSLDHRYYPVDGDPDWTRSYWRKVRQYLVFLRSDLDRPNGEYVEQYHRGRDCVYWLWVIGASVLTVVGFQQVGSVGYLLWPLFSLPMWGVVFYHLLTGSRRWSPFKSRSEFVQYEHLADRHPCFPAYQTARKNHPRSNSVALALFADALALLTFVTFAAIGSIIWPFIARTWVRDNVEVPLPPDDCPAPCIACRRAVHARDYSTLSLLDTTDPHLSLYRCTACNTYWLGQCAIPKCRVRKFYPQVGGR